MITVRLTALAHVLCLVSLCSLSICSFQPPNPPLYPPRWTATADFKFFNASTGEVNAQGVLYQMVDSVTMRFRADDLYFAGSWITTYDTAFGNNLTVIYASLTNGSMKCVEYPQGALPMRQTWIADWCKYNSTVFHGATEAYRWDCVADKVSWSMDTSVPQGLLIYQRTNPQPFFDVYQELWFTSIIPVDSFDQSIFTPPAAWGCPWKCSGEDCPPQAADSRTRKNF